MAYLSVYWPVWLTLHVWVSVCVLLNLNAFLHLVSANCFLLRGVFLYPRHGLQIFTIFLDFLSLSSFSRFLFLEWKLLPKLLSYSFNTFSFSGHWSLLFLFSATVLPHCALTKPSTSQSAKERGKKFVFGGQIHKLVHWDREWGRVRMAKRAKEKSSGLRGKQEHQVEY